MYWRTFICFTVPALNHFYTCTVFDLLSCHKLVFSISILISLVVRKLTERANWKNQCSYSVCRKKAESLLQWHECIWFIHWCFCTWIIAELAENSWFPVAKWSALKYGLMETVISASQLMPVSWSCLPALMWVWFIVQFKPWIDQRPDEMEGTSTAGAFLFLMTVKRKGDMSKHFSGPLFQHHQRCTASLFHHTRSPRTYRKSPQRHLCWWAGYSRLRWCTQRPFIECSSTDLCCHRKHCLHVNSLFCCTNWMLLGLDRYIYICVYVGGLW